MALTAEQRVQLARVISVGLKIKNLNTQDERERELLRLLVLPQAAQLAEMKTLAASAKGFLQLQQAETPAQRAAQDAALASDIATVTDIESSL